MSYTLTTNISWSQTQRDLQEEFRLWNIRNWDTNYPRGAKWEGYGHQTEDERGVTLVYEKDGKKVNLAMAKQKRAVDNLRVIYLAVHDMRMNEKRGIDELLQSAYLQLAGPVGKKPPHEVLGIVEGTSLEVAEAVYRTMASKYHPDSKPSGNAERFKELNEAITTLRGEHGKA